MKLEPSAKAADVNHMVDAYVKLDKLVGLDMPPAGGLEPQKTVADASKEIKKAVKGLNIFAGGEDE